MLDLKRAQSAKNFLENQGIDKNRLNVISYGKTRPENTAHTKDAHRTNRRVVTIIIQ